MARTKAKDHNEKRDHILKTAAQVFATEGLARASMSQVAKACGISKANIYHYYDSKDDLLFDILDSYLKSLRDQIVAVPVNADDPVEELKSMLGTILIAYQGMDAEHKIQTEGISLLPEDQQNILKGHQREMVQRLNRILLSVEPEILEKDRGMLHATTMSVFGMINWYYMWNKTADKEARLKYANLVAKLTVNGVRGLDDM